MDNELIKVERSENGDLLVSGRELHEFLEIKTQYTKWLERMIEYGFEENVDYSPLSQKRLTAQGNETTYIDHVVKLDMAKEISMIQRNNKGKQARLYFINCEKRLKSINTPSYMIDDPIERAEKWIQEHKEKKQLETQNLMLEQQVKEYEPKAEYFDELVEKNLLTNFRDTAKEFKMKQNMFIDWLLERGYVYRDAKGTLKPHSQHTPDLFELKEGKKGKWVGVQTLITPKGRETFRLLLAVGKNK